jgi:hypothetical protein
MRSLKKQLWPYMITIKMDVSNHKLIDIEIWLGETLGIFKKRWNAIYGTGYTNFYFRTEKDALFFTLRWL